MGNSNGSRKGEAEGVQFPFQGMFIELGRSKEVNERPQASVNLVKMHPSFNRGRYTHVHKRRIFFALVPPIFMGVRSVIVATSGLTLSPSLVNRALSKASLP